MSGPTLFVLSSAIRPPARGAPSCPLCPPRCPLPGQPTEPRGRGSWPRRVGEAGSRAAPATARAQTPRLAGLGVREFSFKNSKAGNILDRRCTEWSFSPWGVQAGLLSCVCV